MLAARQGSRRWEDGRTRHLAVQQGAVGGNPNLHQRTASQCLSNTLLAHMTRSRGKWRRETISTCMRLANHPNRQAYGPAEQLSSCFYANVCVIEVSFPDWKLARAIFLGRLEQREKRTVGDCVLWGRRCSSELCYYFTCALWASSLHLTPRLVRKAAKHISL